MAAIPGVTVTSPESTPDLIIDLPMRVGGETETERFFDGYAVIEPGGYAAVHPTTPVAGSLDNLVGTTIAVMQQPIDGITFELGDPATVTVGTTKVRVRIAAILPERLSTDHQILIPHTLLPDNLLASAPTDILVQAHDQDMVARVRTAAQAYGTVTSVDTWITANAEALQRTNNATLVVLLALAGLYTVMAVVDAVVIAGTGRRREHAVARLSGLTRAQVVMTTALEAAVTTITGLILASAILGIALAARRSVDETVIEIPWTPLVATTLGSLVIAMAVSALVSRLVTRTNPIAIAAARE